MSEIHDIAKKLVADNKGLLAADESVDTIQKRFDKVNVENSEENRRIYRELLFTTPNIEEYISGVIMHEETIKQNAGDGRNFVQVLTDKGIIPGIKVDQGKQPLPGFPDETITIGLDTLAARVKEFKDMGAKFTKWRAVYSIGSGLPTKAAVHANAHALARYAALVQEAGMVPIVEPEVLMDGEHRLDQCGIVTNMVLDEVFEQLMTYKVDFSGILLKPNMVVSGKDNKEQASAEEVAEATMEVFKNSIPKDVAGVVFLSGGLSATEATKNLCEINREESGKHSWPLSFSFGRALQNEALEVWSGNGDKWQEAQDVFFNAAKADAEARRGVC